MCCLFVAICDETTGRRPFPGDSQVACIFGQFRFSGCRKIVTTAYSSQIARQNFALAPTGTKFDRLWFTETASGLVLFDGKFPVSPARVLSPFVREFASMAGDPSSTLVNKQDIPVLDQTPWMFRLLASHQDLQFVCDRPSSIWTTSGLHGHLNWLVWSKDSTRSHWLGER